MKKSAKLRLFALAMTLVVALAGCGSNAASTDDDDQQAGNEAESTQEIDWPQKAITVVVPASAGGDTDSYARIFGQYLEQELGQSVVISNVGGAGGTVGTRQVKDAEPDGNTILFYHGSALLNTIMGLADFDVRTDMQIADIPIKDNTQMLFADAKKFKSLQDVIDQCKAEPESVVFGRETGTQAHLVALALEDAAGVKFNQVDIAAGFSNLIAALMGGQIDVFFMTYGSAQDYIASGDIVPLGVFSEERTDAAPDVPTFREQGLDLVFEKFFFYAFPKDTPAEIVEKFNSAVEKVVALPECQEDIAQFALTPEFVNQQDTQAYFDEMYDFYSKYAAMF